MSEIPDAPIVDFAAHFYAPYPEVRRSGDAAKEDYAGAPICTDIEAVRERYADVGIDGAVLSQPGHMGSADVVATEEANDELLGIVDAYDELYGLAAIPVAAGGEHAAEEFVRSLDAGYHGGAVEVESEGIELIDDEFEPILEVADQTGAPVLVHPINNTFRLTSRDDHWKLDKIFRRETRLARSISKAIHEGIFERYPDLTLVFHHNGGNIAAFLGRIEGTLGRAHRNDGSHLKTFEDFLATFEDHVYVDTAGYYGDARQFRRILEALPASNVLFGTDFPYETVLPEQFDAVVEAIESVSGGADRDAVLGGNALNLLVNT